MQKTYVVRFTAAERELWHCLVKKPRVSAQQVLRARVLLKTDADGPNGTDAEIAHAFDCRTHTMENIRERFVTAGFEITRNGQPKRRVRSKILDGDQEAQIMAWRLGPPPPGCAHWTLRLLAEHAVGLDLVEAVSQETLRRTRKKIVSQQGRSPLGSFRRTPMPHAPRAWRKGAMSTPGPTMRSIPCCAWMSRPYRA
jgi:hypothetical protein